MESDGESIVLAAACVAVAAVLVSNRNTRIWTKEWIKKRDEDSGRGVLAMIHKECRVDDPLSFKNFLRMDVETFENLLSIVGPKIARQDTVMRQSISPTQRLSLTLRFLATGETFKSLMFSTRIGHSTISRIVPETLTAIYSSLLEDYLHMPRSKEGWELIAQEFSSIWNFPNCLGAIDGKHINFRPPRSAGSFYYNYKGSNSIVLLAVADANCKFLYIDVGRNGRTSDGGVFRNSTLHQALRDKSLNIPGNKCLPGRSKPTPYVFVADDAFPLQENVMKPHRSRGLTKKQQIFNYRLSRARRVVENAFGIMANRFRVLLGTICLSPAKVEQLTLCCCALHNYLLQTNEDYVSEDDVPHRLSGLSRQGTNHSRHIALSIRNEFEDYFMEEGKVSWQDKSVELFNY